MLSYIYGKQVYAYEKEIFVFGIFVCNVFRTVFAVSLR